MNVFCLRTDSRFRFVGAVNEDVTAYVLHGSRGALVLTNTDSSVHQEQTQKAEGGMTGQYLDGGTALKTAFTIVACPSCVEFMALGPKHRRIHHRVMWRYAVPCVLREG